MSKTAVLAVRSLVVALAGGALLFVIGYFAAIGEHSVPGTVSDDASLPRLALAGTVFHVETFGERSRPVVIVIHGGPGGDYRALKPLSALADRFQVVFYDQRGSGLSARVPADQLNLETFLTDLDAMVEHFGEGSPVHIIGHSWGGGLAAAYTARHPQKVDRLVLAEPVPLGPAMEEAAGVSYGASLDLRLLVTGVGFWLKSLHVDNSDGHARGDYLFTKMAPRANREHHCGGEVAAPDMAMWRMGRQAIRSVRSSLLDRNGALRRDLLDGIQDYSREVLFVVGACSGLIGPPFQERQMEIFADARMIVIEDAGHMMTVDRPAATVAAIRGYLTDSR